MSNAMSQQLLSSTPASDKKVPVVTVQQLSELLIEAADKRAGVIYQEKCVPKPPAIQAPTYPQELIGTNIYGTTVLILEVNPCGEVREVRFQKSSRNRALDRAAMDAAMNWVLDAEQLGHSAGKGGRILVPVDFLPPAPPLTTP